MADDRRQQLADEVRDLLDDEVLRHTGRSIGLLASGYVTTALLPLFDRVAAEAAAEARLLLHEEYRADAPWVAADALDVAADHAYALQFDDSCEVVSWLTSLSAALRQKGRDMGQDLARARAAAHRTPAPSSEENAR